MKPPHIQQNSLGNACFNGNHHNCSWTQCTCKCHSTQPQQNQLPCHCSETNGLQCMVHNPPFEFLKGSPTQQKKPITSTGIAEASAKLVEMKLNDSTPTQPEWMKFGETNIKFLVEEMKKDAEEYNLHNEGCGTDREDECDCENMEIIKNFTHEWMAKVNKKWYELTEAHRPYCTPEGNKVITRILGKNNRDASSTTIQKEIERERSRLLQEIEDVCDDNMRMESDYDDEDKRSRRDVRPYNEAMSYIKAVCKTKRSSPLLPALSKRI